MIRVYCDKCDNEIPGGKFKKWKRKAKTKNLKVHCDVQDDADICQDCIKDIVVHGEDE